MTATHSAVATDVRRQTSFTSSFPSLSLCASVENSGLISEFAVNVPATIYREHSFAQHSFAHHHELPSLRRNHTTTSQLNRKWKKSTLQKSARRKLLPAIGRNGKQSQHPPLPGRKWKKRLHLQFPQRLRIGKPCSCSNQVPGS